MRTKENIEKEIEILETKLSRTRNTVEKADFSSRITNLKNEIAKIEDDKLEKIPVLQKDVPARLDHKESSNRVERQITNTGNVFTALL